jgi:thymidine phosphorylase
VTAPTSGHVARLGAIRVGVAAVHLGAGRRTKNEEIDHSVGVVVHAKRGDRVEEGQPLATIHARDVASARAAAAEVLAAYEIRDAPPEPRPVLLEVVD